MIYTLEEYFKYWLNNTIYNIYYNTITQKFEFHFHSNYTMPDLWQITKSDDKYYMDGVEVSKIWVMNKLTNRYHINMYTWVYKKK
jgi:hypothetical protein